MIQALLILIDLCPKKSQETQIYFFLTVNIGNHLLANILVSFEMYWGGGGSSKDVLEKFLQTTAIVGSVAGAILSFFGKAVGFVAEHAWALIVFVGGLIGVWLMQNVKK